MKNRDNNQYITKKRSFTVLQMNCASCAAKVENSIKSSKGVVSASVNLASKKVVIEYLPKDCNLKDVAKSVKNAGFELIIPKANSNDRNEELKEKEEKDKRDLQQLKNNTIWALIFSAPVFVVGMFFMNMPYADKIMWVFSTPVVLWFGRDFFKNAIRQATKGHVSMDTLVALSTGIAYLFSAFNTLFPHVWHNHGLEAHIYFEAAAVIIAFILLGRWLEERAKNSTSSAIKKLMGIQPKYAIVIGSSGEEKSVNIDKLKKGDLILVKPGEKVPVDGTVKDGDSYTDESLLTGEPIPLHKTKGSKVYAGTINQKGSFRLTAEATGDETTLSRIIELVQEAQGSKAPVQKLADKISSIFVPAVLIIAIISFIIWNFTGIDNSTAYAVTALITVLIIACPCALGLATPTAVMTGIGKAAEMGILIKNAESLETAKNIDVVVLDKTGTITEGKPKVTNIVWLNDDESNSTILKGIEKESEHPLADAITSYLKSYDSATPQKFESITGKGAVALFNNQKWFVGNTKLLKDNNISIESTLKKRAQKYSDEAKTVIWFANSKQAIAVVAISDQIKESAKKGVEKLKEIGIKVYMLTGDNAHTAAVIAGKSGIENFKANVLPAQKAKYIKDLQQQGKTVAMVGDGINDSGALAQSNISIAMGQGSDIAMDVSSMTIISSNLEKISDAIELSKKTSKVIKQNLFWAFIYNTSAIPIAAGILYPFLGFLLNPMVAGAAMALSSVSVITNSLRLKK
ncbi:heavy metal translocating P-type ATPase [Marinilabiliaceae bacterium ANBcel2]|nr:heavy metal translocating P-type ATPase [Marinilabiliaceae bacterium ANBcel2]